ncbi:hypothetical protein CFC35_28060 [Streptomyces sp. FBKL.4005]|uniref:Uncharacterized protein n=1 Tax=Streptomyces bangladeshensis TaxID=295352 RepID=A0ABN3C749_9ACTN|nr:hypothetical protein CFC35_28060 [Streptomyces sp. FBKL.4005]BCM66601.1 hypothetical protein EASAB2608_01935 [Streptomyces sp. EAS-AB2608]
MSRTSRSRKRFGDREGLGSLGFMTAGLGRCAAAGCSLPTGCSLFTGCRVVTGCRTVTDRSALAAAR